MKKLIVLLFPVYCYGQSYKYVDTLLIYKDAKIIIVGNHRDTLYNSKMKKGLYVDSVDVMIVDEKRKLKSK